MTLPISRCNTVGFRLVLSLSLLITSWLALTPSPVPLQESVNDKFAHGATFLLLSFLVHASWPQRPFLGKPLLLLASYGLLIEAVQYFIPNRFFSLLDILADAAGIGLYLLLMPFINRLSGGTPDQPEKPSQL